MSDSEPTSSPSVAAHRRSPTLEELGAEWLHASASFAVGEAGSTSAGVTDGDEVDEVDEDANEPWPDESISPSWATASQQIHALEAARLRQAESIARSGLLDTRAPALDTLTSAPSPRRRGPRPLALALAGMAASAIVGVVAWQLSSAPEPAPTTVVQADAPVATAAPTPVAATLASALADDMNASGAASAAVTTSAAVNPPTIVDRRGGRSQIASMGVSTPLPGGRCDEPVSTLSLATSRKAALCLTIDRPERGPVMVSWIKDGETKRRSRIDAPAARRFTTRALLSLGDDDLGSWTARVTADDAELGSIGFAVTR